MVAEYSVRDHNLRKEIKILITHFLFFILVSKMMKLLAIAHVKAGKTIIKE